MTEPLNREEIKLVFTESIAPLVTEFRAAHDAHEKDIDRLSKQSAEHYKQIKDLEDKLSNQVEKCQIGNTASQERSGLRVGNTEIEMGKINQRIVDIEKDIIEIKDNKKTNKEQWLVWVGIIAMIALGIIPFFRG